jgi:hypothetical protein
MLNWYTKKKRKGRELDLEKFDCCRKKKVNILEFGRKLGKENWSLGICVALYLFYFYFILFSGSIIV